MCFLFDICYMSSKLNYLLILIGGVIALYANAEEDQGQYLLIGGIFVLMVGLYRLSRKIPEKSSDSQKEHHDSNSE